MLKRTLGILFLILFLTPICQVLAASDPKDCDGCKDPALFSRMPGFYLYNYEEKDFDQYTFQVSPDKSQTVEGRHYYADYYANDGVKVPSGLQITRNYINAAQAIGGKTLYEFEDGGTEYVTLKIAKDNTEAWAAISAGSNGMYKIHIIEKKAMKQDVAANADSLSQSINMTGKAAVYGIYFDTDKSEIKPESGSAITGIVKMLKSDTNLKLYVVGHTDNVGTFDHNIKLSLARAAAVVTALVNGNGIAASRLTPFGAGPTAPVTSNSSEEGRAKNRRVELVAQ